MSSAATSRRRFRRGGVLLGAALVALGLFWWTTHQPSRTADATASPSPVEPGNAPAATTPQPGRAESAKPIAVTPQPEPEDAQLAALRERLHHSSLRGSDVDGDVALDGNGQLRLDAELLRRFDYYLSLSGEFSPAEIRRLLEGDLREQHGNAIADAALDTFDRYIGLRQALENSSLPDDPAARLAALRELQRAWFGDAADSLFGEENSLLADTLARRAIETNPDLSEVERSRQLAELDQQRSPSERESRDEANAARLAEEQTEQFDQLDMDAATRHEERAALWGEDAADRLAALDQQRADWDRRLGDYASARQRILDDASLSPDARQQALNRLRESGFDANEQLRVEALERTGGLPSG